MGTWMTKTSTGSNDGSAEDDIEGQIEELSAPQVSIDEIVAAAKDMALWNRKQAAPLSKSALTVTETIAKRINALTKKQFYADLESVLPDWKESIIGTARESMMKVKSVADDMLSGELPSDVRDQIMTSRAELGISRGVFGDLLSNATARDLGLTSLDMVNRGAELTTNAVSLLVQRLLDSAKQLLPPRVDLAALYGTQLNVATGGQMVSPTAVLQSATQAASTNADLALSQQLSALNASMDMYSTNLQNQYNRDALKVARNQGYLDFLGGVGGSMAAMTTGNPAAAAALLGA